MKHAAGLLVFSLIIGWAAVAPAFAWVGPQNVTNDVNADGGDFFPDMASDSQGNLHMVWCDWTSDGNWHIRHRIRSTNGTWSGVTLVSTGQSDTYWVRCAMDSGNNLHVAWHNGSSQVNTEIYYRKRAANGTWGSVVNVSNSAGIGSLYPDIAVDGLGRVFVAWHESVNGWDVAVAMFDGTAWQAPAMIGNTALIDAYPVLACDAANTLHLAYTWDYQEIYYRARSSAGVWSAAVNISHNSGSSRDPHLAVSAAGVPHVVWHDNSGTSWEYYYATTSGGVWQNPVNLSNNADTTDCYGAVAVSPDGSVHAVWQDYQRVYYTRKTGTTWSIPMVLYTSSYNTKHAVVHVDASAKAHVAWQNKEAGVDWDVLYMEKSYPDLTAPSPVSSLVAAAGNTQVQLSWANPSELDYVGTVLRFKATGYPSGPTDGTLLQNGPAARGSAGACTHSGLTNGQTCYYAAFTYDDSGNYSAAATAVATPAVQADQDRDGDVDQADFGLLQKCLNGLLPPIAGCEGANLNGDTTVDEDDVAALLGCKSGPGYYANPNCLP